MSAPYYQDDRVTLYHGDCREITEWLAADVLVTDPPYGIAYAAVAGSRMHRDIANDHDFTTTEAAVETWGPRDMALFASHGSLVRTHALVTDRLSRVRVAVWHKANLMGASPGNPWLADVEFVVMGVTEYPKRPTSAVITARANVGNPAWVTRHNAYLHPTQKSLDGMESLISAMPPGAIADPFAGSGSTLVAAKQLGRHAIGVELEERYCEVIAKRLAQDVLDFGEMGA